MQKLNIHAIYIFIIIALSLSSCKKQADDFNIKGKLANVEGDHIFIRLDSSPVPGMDTIKINEKGEFLHRDQIDTLTLATLFFNDNTKHIRIFVDRGWQIEIKGDALYPNLIEVKGGAANNDLTSFKNENKDLIRSREAILHVHDSIPGREEKLAELKNIEFELSNNVVNYVREDPRRVANVILIDDFFKNEYSIERLDECLGLLRGDAETFPLTSYLSEYSKTVKQSAVGSYAPNFTLRNIKTGQDISLSKFRGSYVVLTFVSSTCDACEIHRQEAIKVYNQIRQDEKNDKNTTKIEFVTIVIDTEIRSIPKAAMDSVKWTILSDEDSWSAKTFKQYNIHEIPYSIIISPQGTILERDVPIFSVRERIKALRDKK